MLSSMIAGSIRLCLELVKLRASQINGCGHCIDMHAKELRAMGEGEQLYLAGAAQTGQPPLRLSIR